ncbi:hypothetical protein CC53_gp013 [Rhizobium phage vB_RleS_L338C]|uniref:hypothetical protein n=1 Tax=Rhizobium phage vB_RleS_L338C TaxID=1414737 RepID=UPI0003D84CFF|nr:hypothetical protein CC53_gp013 [Rhizobium phage vB_RleS_L338C]AHC30430.1 hypothetical protein L338C_013 [Rhizobium phage vB_RleS_L338C]QNH72100.1 hypothetical protein P11VFA_124 [Rhizobium phage P11VFA]
MTVLSTAEMNVRRRLRPEAASPTKDATLYGGYDEQVQGKVRDDIRDRAAYVYITGSFPTHLRRNYNAVLRAITSVFRTPMALDQRGGSIGVQDEAVTDLDLEHHPMVKMVRRRILDGYVIQGARNVVSRRPYSKVFLYRRADPSDRITVQVDGSTKEGWE